jgi:hypothetical protein
MMATVIIFFALIFFSSFGRDLAVDAYDELLPIEKTHNCLIPIQNSNGNANMVVINFGTTTSFNIMSHSLNSPTVIFNGVSGVTNQLMSQYQAILVGRILHVPVELGCFLEINCNDLRWFHVSATCPTQNNSLVSVEKVFNLETFSKLIDVRVTAITDNYLYSNFIGGSFDQKVDRKDFESNVLKVTKI